MTEIRPTSVIVGTGGRRRDEELPADAVFLLTGYHADWDLMARAGIELERARRADSTIPRRSRPTCPACSSPAAPSAGVDTGTIFIENGRFHGEKIVEVIADGQTAVATRGTRSRDHLPVL